MLIQSLIEGGRSFTKTLRYDLPDEAMIAAAILKDVGAEGVALFLDDGSRADALRQALQDCPMQTWVWNILEPMPPLPKARVQAKERSPSARKPTRLGPSRHHQHRFHRLAPLSGGLPAPFSQVGISAPGGLNETAAALPGLT